MSMILMLKNRQVYDIDNKTVLDKKLLPGLMTTGDNYSELFKMWMTTRYSTLSNIISRRLRGTTFGGQGKRQLIDKTTLAFSLSDCYWIKDSTSNLIFEDMSPYYKKFWTGTGNYEGGAVPTLYVGGVLPKEWIDSNTLIKHGGRVEIECSRLCKLIGISVADVKLFSESDGVRIAVSNITSTERMLEQADQSGTFDIEDFTETDVLNEFGMQGLQMLAVDVIFGNLDRHCGNFGYMRDTNTGEYLGMSPLYDFDKALELTSNCDEFMVSLVDSLDSSDTNTNYILEVIRICDIVVKESINNIFISRATELKKLVLRVVRKDELDLIAEKYINVGE